MEKKKFKDLKVGDKVYMLTEDSYEVAGVNTKMKIEYNQYSLVLRKKLMRLSLKLMLTRFLGTAQVFGGTLRTMVEICTLPQTRRRRLSSMRAQSRLQHD